MAKPFHLPPCSTIRFTALPHYCGGQQIIVQIRTSLKSEGYPEGFGSLLGIPPFKISKYLPFHAFGFFFLILIESSAIMVINENLMFNRTR